LENIEKQEAKKFVMGGGGDGALEHS